MYFIRHAIEFAGKIFHGCLQKQDVGQTALLMFSVNLLRDFFQRPRVRIDPDVKLPLVPPRTLVYKETVAGPDIDYYPVACRER